jgi:DNA-directed RNA polymerase subunit alpha
MEQLLLPTSVELIKDKDPRKAALVISPCYPGYGTTVGNALRRVLLSSLPGAAVVAVKIQGVDPEFSILPHVKEDIVQIILNLKQLRLKVFSEETVRLTLEASGEREVTAADITPSSDVEIVTKDLHIAELTNKDAKLSMEIFVRQGRGYIPIEEREEEKKEIGVIQIDSVFTPMRNVGYRVEDVRVGQKTNFDKLTLTLETDGTLEPAEAVRSATKILLDHFNLLANVEEEKKKKKSASTTAVEQAPELPDQI